MIYRLTIAYRGTAYSGWQRQQNAVTVQQRVEEGLAMVLGSEVHVVAASRTDRGVHARGQVVHLEGPDDFPLAGLLHGTNTHLPEDIRVLRAERMPAGFHARYKASWKKYCYRLVRAEVLSPFDAPFAVRVSRQLDLETMRESTPAMVGEHDFSAFALAGGSHRSSRRRILRAEWIEEGDRLEFQVSGDGFLRGMVRSLVGTLLEVGRGSRTPESFARLLEGGSRSEAGPTAPACGLCLEEVHYPEEWRSEGREDSSTL